MKSMLAVCYILTAYFGITTSKFLYVKQPIESGLNSQTNSFDRIMLRRPLTDELQTSCTDCAASQVTFAQGDGNSQIDTSGILGSDAKSGCLTLTATCTADAGFFVFMQFNWNQIGPAENANMGRTINALLNCVDGNWVYTSGGFSVIVFEVSCLQAPTGG